ncbi:MAG: hypothetical protein ABSD08_08145 [Xanthobacteraceae bacterium]
MKIAQTLLAITVTCFVLHGRCQGQEAPLSGPAQWSYPLNSALFDMQQKLDDMRDQIAVQKASSSPSIWTLFDMRQKLDDMRDQLAAQKASSSLSASSLFDMRQKLNDMQDQIQYRAEQMRFKDVTRSMQGLALDPGFEMYEALAPTAFEEAGQALVREGHAPAFGLGGDVMTYLFMGYDMGKLYAVSRGWISPSEAPLVGYLYSLFASIPDTFNPSPCGGRSCAVSYSYRIIQTPQGTTVTMSSAPQAPISPSRVTPQFDARAPQFDARQPSTNAPVTSINGCRVTNDVRCSPPSNYNRALRPPRPPPNGAGAGDGGDGGSPPPKNGGVARTDETGTVATGTAVRDPAGVDADVRPIPAGNVPAGLGQSVINSRKGCTTPACAMQ